MSNKYMKGEISKPRAPNACAENFPVRERQVNEKRLLKATSARSMRKRISQAASTKNVKRNSQAASTEYLTREFSKS